MTAVDGRYSWVILLCSFYFHFAGAGAGYAINVFYTSWVEDFQASRGVTSWVVTIFFTACFGSGPLVSSLVAKYGHRPVIITGTLINASAMFASCFSTSIYILIVLVGVQSGIGLGMMYLPFVAIIPLYFEKRRSLAMGIATSGMGIGTFVYPPFFTWLEEQMHWRGSMVVLSGIILNVAVCGALVRPIDPNPKQASEKDKSERKSSSIPESGYASSVSESGSPSLQNLRNGSITESRNRDESPSTLIASQDKCTVWTTDQVSYVKESIQHENALHENKESVQYVSNERHITMINCSRDKTKDAHLKFSNIDQSSPNPSPNESDISMVKLNPQLSQTSSVAESTDDLSKTGDSVKDPNELTTAVWRIEKMQQPVGDIFTETGSALTVNTQTDLEERKSSLTSSKRTEPTTSPNERPSYMAAFKKLMKNPYFAAFAVSNFLTCMTFLMPPVYMADRAIENGVEKAKAALALSMYGAGNLFGRLGFGIVADHVLDSLILNSICLVMCGVSTCLSPLCGGNAVLHGVYGFTFGTFIGGYMTLTPLILVELMGVTMLNSSFGLVLMFRAGGMLLGTPIAGWIYDATDSYTASFVLHGIIIGMSGVILVGLKVAVVRSKRRDIATIPATESPL